MRIPSYKRINTGDFKKDQQPLIEQLGQLINGSFDGLFQLANNGINFSDNVASTVTTLPITVDADGNPTQTTIFPLKLVTGVVGLWVIDAVSQTTPRVYPTGAPFISWTKNQQTIVINNITGLPAGVPFNLKIITLQN